MMTISDKYSFAPTPPNTLDSFFPTAEDLASRSTDDAFGVSYQTMGAAPQPNEKTDFGVSYGNTIGTPVFQDLVAQYGWENAATDTSSQEIPPMNSNFLTDPKNKTLLIGAGVLLAIGAVYVVSTKSGKKGGKK